MDDVFDRNMRFLLWRERPEARSEWVQLLSEWAQVSPQRALALLIGTVAPTPDELSRLQDATHHPQEELSYGDFVMDSGCDILVENVQFLLSTMERGERKKLAEGANIHPTTVSRWDGKQRPSAESVAAIASYFGIQPSTIREEALFLSMEPISSRQKRDVIRDAVTRLSDEELVALYPALERLLLPK